MWLGVAERFRVPDFVHAPGIAPALLADLRARSDDDALQRRGLLDEGVATLERTLVPRHSRRQAISAFVLSSKK